MGGAFEDKTSCGKVFDECVSGILEKGETDCELKPHPLSHYSKIDWCIQEADVPIALRKDKLEFGQGGSDPYMQISRCYDLVVEVLTDCSTKDSNLNASNFLTHGAPCFLICLIGTWRPSLILASVDLILPGPMLFVCGGFFDGHKPVVEPLGQPVFMLADHTRTRQGEVARLLGALVRGISSLRRWGHDGNPFRHLPLTQYCLQACDWTF